MPTPDEIKLFEDFQLCEICGNDYQDSAFVHVVITSDEDPTQKRYYALCKHCREKCRTDAAFEKYVTKKVFTEKLGRRIIPAAEVEESDDTPADYYNGDEYSEGLE